MTIEPLVLVLEMARADRAGDPYAFSFGQQIYVLRSERGGYETVQIEWGHDLLAALDAVRQPRRAHSALVSLGERLRSILQPAGWPEYESEIRKAVQGGRSVLLVMRFAAAELYALPWELLTLKSTGQHLGELPNFTCHYEWPDTETALTSSTEYAHESTDRILIGWSAAGGAVPAAEHAKMIIENCPSLICDILPHMSCLSLSEKLSAARQEGNPYSMLHILCHGGAADRGFGLILDGQDLHPRVTSPVTIRQLLAPYADTIRLVVLCACDSGNDGALGNQVGSVAQALHRAGFAHVVASRYPFSVTGSINLTQILYKEYLATKGSAMRALMKTRRRLIENNSQLDWISVQLYARVSDEGCRETRRQWPPELTEKVQVARKAEPGQLVGRYRITQRIGSMELEQQFEVMHEDTGLIGELLVLHEDRANHPEAVEQFLGQARLANKIAHSGFPRIYEIGRLADGAPFVIQEQSDGKRLKDIPLPIESVDAARIVRAVAQALVAAHEKQVLHLDLKPSCIRVFHDASQADSIRVRINDIGRSNILYRAKEKERARPRMILFGTPRYNAPEQLTGNVLTDRTDVFILGIIFYELLSGKHPFESGDAASMIAVLMMKDADPIQDIITIDTKIAELLSVMLDKKPANRPTMRYVVSRLSLV